MAEANWVSPSAQHLQQLDLDGGVADVVFTADNVGGAVGDVVDHAGQGRGWRAVAAHQDGIRHVRQRDPAAGPGQVVPFQGPAGQLEPPVRTLAASLGVVRCLSVSDSMPRS